MEENSSNILIVMLVLAAIALLGFIAWMLLATDAENAEEAACRQSIAAHTLLVRASGANIEPRIECSPRSTHLVGNSEEVKRALAEELLFCWERWMNGEAELFVTEGTYCNPCSTITFDPKTQLGEFEAFLAKEKPARSSLTYKEHLFPYASAHYPINPPAEAHTVIDPTQQYVVVFYHDKNHSLKGFLDTVQDDPSKIVNAVEQLTGGAKWGAGIGLGIGVVLGGLCAGASGGICAPAGAGFALALGGAGMTIGAAVGGGKVIAINEFAYPEWFSSVILMPHDAAAYRALHCDAINQEGPAAQVHGAENI
jgi:hypothetical protein